MHASASYPVMVRRWKPSVPEITSLVELMVPVDKQDQVAALKEQISLYYYVPFDQIQLSEVNFHHSLFSYAVHLCGIWSTTSGHMQDHHLWTINSDQVKFYVHNQAESFVQAFPTTAWSKWPYTKDRIDLYENVAFGNGEVPSGGTFNGKLIYFK